MDCCKRAEERKIRNAERSVEFSSLNRLEIVVSSNQQLSSLRGNVQ